MVHSILADSFSTRDSHRSDDKEQLSMETFGALFQECVSQRNDEQQRSPSPEKTGLNDAQKYMAGNIKSLAMASIMIENAEKEEDEEKGEKKQSAKPGSEITKISLSTSDLDMAPKSAGSAESEIQTMPDGSKVLVLKTQISEVVTTSIRIPLCGQTDKVPNEQKNMIPANMPETPAAL